MQCRGYTIGGHSLGKHKFSFDSSIRPFYIALLAAAICTFIGAPLALVTILAANSGVNVLAMILIWIPALVAFGSAGPVYAAITRNAIYAGMILEDGHRFHSTVSPAGLTMVVLTNTVAVILSFGLMLPWALVRLTKYLCAAYLGRTQRLA